ncbi:hydrolase [Rhizosaccharibacter radicis]|uniref:Hydrolase n=1 Tax=Rhizosaccharibacter radicis TaxID=2782605 RepID=A0ABT1VX78_9PROT|nr:hydrolase [Acetobacteraceae bacterium KSS12]
MLTLDPVTTALVLIDLQNGIVGIPHLAPRSGAEVESAGRALAERFRAAGAPVVLVNVGWSADGGDMLRSPVDRPMPRPEGGLPPGWSDLVDGLAQPTDLRVTKHQWGAFHGTNLDTQLRRRGVRTIVLAGIATNAGVESTARQAWEHGYEVVIAEDATASISAEMHEFAIGKLLPMIARIRSSAEIGF